MDNGLVLCNEVKYGTSDFAVLILIIVDNGLVPKIRQNMPELSCCINPCCSGQWSRTHSSQYDAWTACTVLILIVVEDGLVLHYDIKTETSLLSLNPCCSGQWSSTIERYEDGDVFVKS